MDILKQKCQWRAFDILWNNHYMALLNKIFVKTWNSNGRKWDFLLFLNPVLSVVKKINVFTADVRLDKFCLQHKTFLKNMRITSTLLIEDYLIDVNQHYCIEYYYSEDFYSDAFLKENLDNKMRRIVPLANYLIENVERYE
jgi:hypothetical protein